MNVWFAFCDLDTEVHVLSSVVLPLIQIGLRKHRSKEAYPTWQDIVWHENDVSCA